MYSPRIDMGVRLAGQKAEKADEFITRSQLVGGVYTTISYPDGDVAVDVDLAGHDAETRIVARRTAAGLAATITTTGVVLDFAAADYAHPVLVSSGGVTVLTATRPGYYRIDTALYVRRTGGAGGMLLEMVYRTTSPAADHVADRAFLPDAAVSEQASAMHGHTEMLLAAGGQLSVVLRSSGSMPAEIDGALTIRFVRSV